MPLVTLPSGIAIDHETFGDPSDAPLLLVPGLRAQRTGFDPRFLGRLVEQGFFVITYDNRDAGLSTSVDGPAPDFAAILGGDPATVSYTLDDMAQDGIGLLDHLGIGRAHVVGTSMGGMIAQIMAIKHADRLLSLCSIMSTNGDPSVGHSDPAVLAVLQRPPGSTREEIVEQGAQGGLAIASRKLGVTIEKMRLKSAAGYDRSYRPEGGDRQLAAIYVAGDRTEALRGVTVPTVVIHGELDPLINVSGARATAAAIPDAELVVIPDMAHDLPEPAWPVIVDAITKNARRAS
ncbi:pimeloyl-ACP methyl ester carboxylesterase [Crossiella equi]|uniref:Pimeloyl-ACP methyl ester carboxylesterase n=1 Tax=Crossiella equi TaxID=130796 RepID=A0ABS5ADU7_9PSEU|nr:alpha/beta fold hydrolase [Crossiella equi]MBP2474437.1 pimeloyl-ACP methyl ester carboxylesterase [Crossiella equi]